MTGRRWALLVATIVLAAGLWIVCTFAAAFFACDPGSPFFCDAVDSRARVNVPIALLLAGAAVALPVLVLPIRVAVRVVLAIVVAIAGAAASSAVSGARPNGCSTAAVSYVDGC